MPSLRWKREAIVNAQQLEALAKELKLTKIHVRFAQALVLDPERNATKAYQAAGGTKHKKAAEVSGSRLLGQAKIQRYMAALLEGATKEAEKIVGSTIRTLGESLAATSERAAGRAPTETRIYHETQDGKPVTRKVERFAVQQADDSLIRHYESAYAQKNAPPPPPVQVTVFNVAALSLEEIKTLMAIRAKALAPAPPIEIEKAG